jgi:hypothetical protein
MQNESSDKSGGAIMQLCSVYVKCPECGATHCRPERVDPDDPPETLENTCIAHHPARNAGFEGCGEDVELVVTEVETRG